MTIHYIEPGTERTSRQTVYEAFADADRSVDESLRTALDAGIQRLGAEIGFVTDISDGVQNITMVRGPGAGELITVGDSCPLDEAYCRRTIELDSVLCVQHASGSSDVSDAAYRSFGFETYIGTKILVDGETYGTVCFAAREPRSEPFSTSDELFVELLGRLAGRALERRDYERTLEEQNEMLRKQTARFERIADTTFDLLFELAPSGEFTYVSTGAKTILDYQPATLSGNHFADLIAPSSLPDALNAFERTTTGEMVTNLELTLETSDGEQVVLEVNATPVVEDGDIVAVQGVARDITARHEREAELRVKTRAIDSASIGIVISDASRPDYPITYVNEAFEELTGYRCGSILDRNCRILQGPKTDPESVDHLRDAIDAAEPVTVELINYRQDGTPFWNRVRIVPVGPDGDPSHFVGFQEDVTDQRRTSRLIGLLNRVLRHNLRNELNIIQGYSALLNEDADTDAHRQATDIIETTTQKLVHLSDTVRELEDIARQDRNPIRLDVDTLLAESVVGPIDSHPDATVDCRFDLPSDLDICAGLELRRALEELIENAIIHDPDPETRVVVTARQVGDEVELRVEDDGTGIPPVEAAVIKEGHETTVEHGNGLGLWLVNWIVTRYGGSFQIRPADDDDALSGTVASISLPGLWQDESPADVVRPHTTLFQ